MSFPGFKIMKVVRRRNLDGARTEFTVDQNGVADDRDGSGGEGKSEGFPNPLMVSRVFRMNGDRGVREQRLRSGGGNGEERAWMIGQRIMNVVQLAGYRVMFDLNV